MSAKLEEALAVIGALETALADFGVERMAGVSEAFAVAAEDSADVAIRRLAMVGYDDANQLHRELRSAVRALARMRRLAAQLGAAK